ncbi:MAG: lysozyme [Moritella sp.]|uniref:lysozyme n=1 Tax=Moritella sp. TaxID=78556 RepID=UPI0026006FF2|nr:lysozyme [Moritella sp.]NQZ90755.1 lysozyme [Moritella sp.]
MNQKEFSNEGRQALTIAEGFMPRLYDDGGNGKGHCTIGYGHLVHYDPCNSQKFHSEQQFINGISVEKGISLLKKDYAFAEVAVNDLVKVSLNQNQFDALVIFIFNVGRGAFYKSTLLKKLNAGSYESVPSELRRWNRSGGKIMNGLISRREKEVVLFNKKVNK